MAFETPAFSVPGTLTADSDLSTSQYQIVKLSDDSEVDLCTSETDKPLGVLQNDPSSGEQAQVMALGVSKVKVGSSLTAGTDIGISSDAQAVEIDQTSTSNGYVIGSMLKGVSASGNIGTAVINCMAPSYNK